MDENHLLRDILQTSQSTRDIAIRTESKVDSIDNRVTVLEKNSSIKPPPIVPSPIESIILHWKGIAGIIVAVGIAIAAVLKVTL